jgi:acetyl esterase/lipase
MNDMAGAPNRPYTPDFRPDLVLFRTAIRHLLRPVFNSVIPFRAQRVAMHQLTRVSRAPGAIRFRRVLAGNVFGIEAAPTSPNSRVVLYFHGGGFVLGSSESHRALIGHMSQACHARVIAPDYALAPESPYPAALNDALSAYRGLVGQGVASQDIVLAGDSAGGCLAVITALAIAKSALPGPGAVVAFSPWTDLGLSQLHQTPREIMLGERWLQACAQAYLKDQSVTDSLVSPVHGEFSGVPKVLIQVGSDEILLNDARRLAKRIEITGGEVVLQEYPGMWHGFQFHAGLLGESDRALRAVGEFLGG